ncbi:MAG: 2-aminoethylphosphonate--pyruvate transaminase [Proteobacteria bacterium]|nr:2-aminoethylphosphonate--pyruvate transaminase [Pseudomonadota bacterium]
MTDAHSPWLLTPGPLTTSAGVKNAMLRDYGSRDREFIKINARVRERLLKIGGVTESHVCVPIQGSGTFAVEATLGTVIPRDSKSLVLINGSYGHRIAGILGYLNRECLSMETPEHIPADVPALDRKLAEDPDIANVIAVHCETTAGILNPIEEIAQTVARHGRMLLIDAMSSFGAIEISPDKVPYAALIASANKCLEGVPGMGFALIDKQVLSGCKGNSHSLSLDLFDQFEVMEKSNQWRFTPPTHVIVAFDQALEEFEAEGGITGRHSRYRKNCDELLMGLRELGFHTLLPDALQAPIIVTVLTPDDPRFDFNDFYDRLCAKGFAIYPGKLTKIDTFRIGCIGRLGETVIHDALGAIKQVLEDMGVQNCAPQRAPKDSA